MTPEELVRPSILSESDGPMLVVGLQAIHGTSIALPDQVGQRPDRDRLAARMTLFEAAS
jgi:putative restriction endonuclease